MKKISIIVISKASSQFLGFIITIIISKFYGLEALAQYALYLTVIAIVSLIAMVGLDLWLLIKLQTISTKLKYTQRSKYYLFVSFTSILICFGYLFTVNNTHSSINEIIVVLALIASFLRLQQVELQSRGRPISSQFVTELIKNIFILSLIFISINYLAVKNIPLCLVISYFVTFLINEIIIQINESKRKADINLSITLFDNRLITGVELAATNIIIAIFAQIPIIFLEYIGANEVLAKYYIYFRLASIVMMIYSSFITIEAGQIKSENLNEISETYVENFKQKNKLLFVLSLTLMVLVMLLIPIFEYLYSETVDLNYIEFTFFAIGFLYSMAVGPNWLLLVAFNKHSELARHLLPWSIIIVAVQFITINNFTYAAYACFTMAWCTLQLIMRRVQIREIGARIAIWE